MIPKKPNFKELDRQIRFCYKDDLLVAADQHGYTYISECVYELYAGGDSSREISVKMSVSAQTVLFWMHRWNMRLRSQGGNNTNVPLRDPKIRQAVIDLKGQMTYGMAARKMGVCCASAVRKIWREEA